MIQAPNNKGTYMKKNIVHFLYALLFFTTHFIFPYQVRASNFYRPRAKTLRRIAKNLGLATAIDKIRNHALFNLEQADLLQAFPTFRSNFFTKSSIVKTKSGAIYTVPTLLTALKNLEEVLRTIQQNASYDYISEVNKVLNAIQEFLIELEKINQ